MSIPYVGHASNIGLAQEVTYGTAVSPRTRWMRVTEAGLARRILRQPVEDLAADGLAANERYRVQTGEESGGSIGGWVAFNDHCLTFLLKNALGSISTTGSGPYTHTAVMRTALPSLTISQNQGGSVGEVFEGCKINRLTLDVEPGRQMRVSAEIIAETAGGPTTTETPTYVSTPVWLTHDTAGTLSFDGETYRIQRFSVTIDNRLIRRPALGLQYTLEPARSAKSEVTVQVTLERTTNALQEAHNADTEGDLVLAFTSGTNSLTVTGHNAVPFEWSSTPSGVGPITEQVTFRCFGDGTDEGLSVVVVNANSSAV
jgi:hypothetical protein